MNRILYPLLIVLALTACGTSGPVASIEDRNQPTKGAAPDKAGGNGPEAQPAGTSPSVTTSADKGVDTTGLVPSGASTGTSPSDTTSGDKGVDTTGLVPSGASSGAANDQATTEGSVSGKNVDPRRDPASPLSKRSIYFDFDSDLIKDDYQTMIEAHAAYLVAHKDAKLTLQGNTDARGSREYNLALGQRRAEAVRKALSVLGVSGAQMEAVSFGEEKPHALGDTEQSYAENRRVDMVYSDDVTGPHEASDARGGL